MNEENDIWDRWILRLLSLFYKNVIWKKEKNESMKTMKKVLKNYTKSNQFIIVKNTDYSNITSCDDGMKTTAVLQVFSDDILMK